MPERVTATATRPTKTDGSARSSWGLGSRKRWSHQGLWWCMYPRGWLPRRSWQLEHNQCHSPFNFVFAPAPIPSPVLIPFQQFCGKAGRDVCSA